MNLSKKVISTIAVLALLLISVSCSKEPRIKDNFSATPEKTPEEKLLKPNEPIFQDQFFADPSAHVFENKLYIYPSHDIENDIPADNDGSQYAMEDYHVLSISDFDSPCVDHGQVLHLKDVPWAKRQMWAPDAAYKNGKYYLYFPAKDKDDIFRIGVATSSSPNGTFVARENYIEGSFSMDPAVFTDDDNKSYMYFGGIWGGQLEKWKSGEFDINANTPEGSEAALGPIVATLSDDMLSFEDTPKEISIVDEEGKPLVADDENRRFFEAAWVHKYDGKYYLSYSTGTTHYIVYAISDDPMGPFTYKGKILAPVEGWTTHHSIVEYKGKWYLFYHDASVSGIDNKRSVKYSELFYNSDGTIKPIEN